MSYCLSSLFVFLLSIYLPAATLPDINLVPVQGANTVPVARTGGTPPESQRPLMAQSKDAGQSVEGRVADLLAQMTLAEKVGQMTQIDVARLMGEGEWDRGPLSEEWLQTIFEKNQVGSILSGGGAAPVPNTPEAWAEMTNQLQDAALEYSRLDIPMIYGIDAVHGLAAPQTFVLRHPHRQQIFLRGRGCKGGLTGAAVIIRAEGSR